MIYIYIYIYRYTFQISYKYIKMNFKKNLSRRLFILSFSFLSFFSRRKLLTCLFVSAHLFLSPTYWRTAALWRERKGKMKKKISAPFCLLGLQFFRQVNFQGTSLKAACVSLCQGLGLVRAKRPKYAPFPKPFHSLLSYIYYHYKIKREKWGRNDIHHQNFFI